MGDVVLVTGGGGGIGAALCRAIAAQGVTVVVADLDGDRAAVVAAEIDGLGVTMDVTDPGSVCAAVDEVTDRLGPVTGLVNNAGVDVIGRFVDSTPDTWDRLIAVNLRGTITVTRAVLDGMIAREEGRIRLCRLRRGARRLVG